MKDIGLKICPNCKAVIAYNSYFQTYCCTKCGYCEDNEEVLRYYINADEIGMIFKKVLGES